MSAVFTMQFRRYIDLYGVDNLGLNTYPIFDEAHRDTLNQKIIDRFEMREIGVEDTGLFAQRFRREMNEIMPYYNQLYETEKVKYDPLITQLVESENSANQSQENTSEGNSTALSKAESGNRNVFSETPQQRLKGNADYASNATDVTGLTETDTSATEQGRQSATVDTTGKQRTKAQTAPAPVLIAQWRQSLINIDLVILDDLDKLFMQIWDTNDNYTNNNIWPYGLAGWGAF